MSSSTASPAGWPTTDRFVLAAPVVMGVVCFGFAPDGLDGTVCDRVNREIVESINASGLAYLTHTEVRGRIVMRVGIGNILTTEEQIAGVWATIVAAAPVRG